MSRSGYSDDYDGSQWDLIRWRGAVASSIRGRRGQSFLEELLVALEAMPEKRLISQSFRKAGSYCTLGVIGASRGVEMPLVPDDADDLDDYLILEQASKALQIPGALAAEIMFVNDEGDWGVEETPEKRWQRMHDWVAKRIKAPQPSEASQEELK